MTLVVMQEDENGDLTDILVFCGSLCAAEYAGQHVDAEVIDIPAFEPGSHAYCEMCKDSVKHGANCYAALTNELTEECPEVARDGS